MADVSGLQASVVGPGGPEVGGQVDEGDVADGLDGDGRFRERQRPEGPLDVAQARHGRRLGNPWRDGISAAVLARVLPRLVCRLRRSLPQEIERPRRGRSAELAGRQGARCRNLRPRCQRCRPLGDTHTRGSSRRCIASWPGASSRASPRSFGLRGGSCTRWGHLNCGVSAYPGIGRRPRSVLALVASRRQVVPQALPSPGDRRRSCARTPLIRRGPTARRAIRRHCHCKVCRRVNLAGADFRTGLPC